MIMIGSFGMCDDSSLVQCCHTHLPRQTRPDRRCTKSLCIILPHNYNHYNYNNYNNNYNYYNYILHQLQIQQLNNNNNYNYNHNHIYNHNYIYNLHQACFYSRVRSSFWPLSSTLVGELPLNPKVMSKIVPSLTTTSSFLHLHAWPIYQLLKLSALLLNLFKPLKSPITIG